VQSSYGVHHVTREEFERKIEERRKMDWLELDGRSEVGQNEKTLASLKAAELATGKRVLQAAAAMSVECNTEVSLARV